MAILLASELAERGLSTILIDADANHTALSWSKLPGRPEKLTVLESTRHSGTDAEAILDDIEDAAKRAAFVLVDLEGTAAEIAGYAVSLSTLVVIPVQGYYPETKGAAKALNLVKAQERVARRRIPSVCVFTRTLAAVQTLEQRQMAAELEKLGANILDVELVNRVAFGSLHSYGGTLKTLDPTVVHGVVEARANAAAFARAVLATIAPTKTVVEKRPTINAARP